jgi:molecular chaperone DnaK
VSHAGGSLRIAAYHLGGGSFEFSVMDTGEDVLQVKSMCGDTSLGGDDFDQRVFDYLADKFQKQFHLDPRQDPGACLRLWAAAEQAKCRLSKEQRVIIELPDLLSDQGTPCHFKASLTRKKLEELTADLVEKTLLACRQALSDAEVEASQIDILLLTGRQAHMPLVQQKLKEIFSHGPVFQVLSAESVVKGAAILAGVQMGEVADCLLLEAAPLTLGVEDQEGAFRTLISRNATLPIGKKVGFTTTADGQSRLEIRLCQGERPLFADNTRIGRFSIEGIPSQPKGIPQYDFEFNLDVNGLLQVAAVEHASGKPQMLVRRN